MLTKGDMRLVHSLVSADGYFGSNADMPAGCFAYVHTRRDSKLMVSSQMLVSNNESIISTYSSDTQYALSLAKRTAKGFGHEAQGSFWTLRDSVA